MTKAELRVLRAQLHAERSRLREVAAELSALSSTLSGRAPDEYRRFRHAFRHMYYVDLDWARLLPLVTGAPALLDAFEAALDELLSRLGA